MDVFPFWGSCYSVVWLDHILSPLACRGTRGSSRLPSVVGVYLGVWASESLLSVPWGGDPEVGLPRHIIILD